MGGIVKKNFYAILEDEMSQIYQKSKRNNVILLAMIYLWFIGFNWGDRDLALLLSFGWLSFVASVDWSSTPVALVSVLPNLRILPTSGKM